LAINNVLKKMIRRDAPDRMSAENGQLRPEGQAFAPGVRNHPVMAGEAPPVLAGLVLDHDQNN